MSIQTIFETTYYRNNFIPRSEWDNDPTLIKLKFLRQNLARAANRGNESKEIKIKLDDVYTVGEQQGWRCAFTGLPLEFTRGGTYWGGKWCNPNSCTIDRIDSSKGYVKNNIQLVTWKVNCIKRDLPDDEFIEICKLVAQNCQ